MAGVNEGIVTGRVGGDLILRHTRGDTPKPVTNIQIAFDHPHDYRRDYGKRRTCWFSVRVWGNLAESAVKNLVKGDKVDIGYVLMNEEEEYKGVKKMNTILEARFIRYIKVKKFDNPQTASGVQSDDDDLPM